MFLFGNDSKCPVGFKTMRIDWVLSYAVKWRLNPSRPDAGRREKINLKFYFHTS